MRVRPLTLPSYWSSWAMPACDWSKSGGQRAAPETSTISSVSVEKNVFFASVNYTQVQYYTLSFTLINTKNGAFLEILQSHWSTLCVWIIHYILHHLCTFTLASLSVNYSWTENFNEPFYGPCDFLSAQKNRLLLYIFQNISQQIFREIFQPYFLKEKAWWAKLKRFWRGRSHLNWVFCWKYHKLCSIRRENT